MLKAKYYYNIRFPLLNQRSSVGRKQQQLTIQAISDSTLSADLYEAIFGVNLSKPGSSQLTGSKIKAYCYVLSIIIKISRQSKEVNGI